MENSIVIYGASGHGKVLVDLISEIKLEILALVDDSPNTSCILGIVVQQASEFEFTPRSNTILAIGNNKIRQKLSQKLKVNFVTLVHPTAIVSKFVKMGEGTVVLAGAIINPDTSIGKHCIINSGAVVEHDCFMEDFVHISPNASLAGNVFVGEGVQVGIGAVVIQGVKIGKWAVIGAGAVIIRDVPDYAVVVGNPGKIIKYTTNE